MKLSDRSTRNLNGVHLDLVKIIQRAAQDTDLDFIVTEGVRTVARQAELFKEHATRTMKSRHIPDSNVCHVGCAVDLAVMIGGEVRWDWPLYDRLAPIIKKAAADVNVPIEWGGDWSTLKDGPHYQLPWGAYP
jgi:peptidoglycan L-alanyl-D-glutamate endopeptidase CwlK